MAEAVLSTVLTVEDDPIVRADLRLVLEDAGFEVCADAGDGLQAVALARKHRPDLILMDLGLPNLDGIEATRQIRRESNVPIVVLSGQGSELVERAMGAGADAHVSKPVHSLRLVETVIESLRSHVDTRDRAHLKDLHTMLLSERQAHGERMRRAGRDSSAWDWERAAPRSFADWFGMWSGSGSRG